MANQPENKDDSITFDHTKEREMVKKTLNKKTESWNTTGDSRSMQVNLAVWIEWMGKVDEVNSTVDIDFYVRFNWIQEHIKLNSLGYENGFKISPDMVERHCIYVDNGSSLQPIGESKLVVEDKTTGMVRMVQRMRGSLSQLEFDYHQFPLDVQNIRLVFQSRKGNVVIETGDWYVGEPERKGPSSFSNLSMQFNLKDTEWNKVTHQYIINIATKRDCHYYFWNVMLLLYIITNFSLFSYGVSAFNDRLSFDITLLLTIVAFLFSVKSTLPKIKYLTLLDKYILLCFAFIISIAVEHFVISVTTYSVEGKHAFEKAFYSSYAMIWFLFHLAVAVKSL
eukprot:201248_1